MPSTARRTVQLLSVVLGGSSSKRNDSKETTGDQQDLDATIIVIVGDANVGKSMLLETAVKGKYPKSAPLPCWFEGEAVKLEHFDGKVTTMNLTVGSGQDDFRDDKIDKLLYKDAHLLLVCFPVADAPPGSGDLRPDLGCKKAFNNARNDWIPAIRNITPDATIVLVGTKADRRAFAEETGLPYIHQTEIAQLKRECKAARYYEVSAEQADPLGLHNMFLDLGLLAHNLKHQAEADKKAKGKSSTCIVQ